MAAMITPNNAHVGAETTCHILDLPDELLLKIVEETISHSLKSWIQKDRGSARRTHSTVVKYRSLFCYGHETFRQIRCFRACKRLYNIALDAVRSQNPRVILASYRQNAAGIDRFLLRGTLGTQNLFLHSTKSIRLMMRWENTNKDREADPEELLQRLYDLMSKCTTLETIIVDFSPMTPSWYHEAVDNMLFAVADTIKERYGHDVKYETVKFPKAGEGTVLENE